MLSFSGDQFGSSKFAASHIDVARPPLVIPTHKANHGWPRKARAQLQPPPPLDSPRMELGGGGRGAGDRARRQLQAVGRLVAYLGGGFLIFSVASSVAVRSLRALSDANQRKFAMPCGACAGKGTYACRLCKGSTTIEWSPMYDPVFINPCLCPTCDGTRVQRCLNCLGKGYA